MDRLIGYFSRGFIVVAGAALLLLVLLATGNVGLRLFHLPFAGTYEIVSFLGALVTAGALAHTQRRRDHIMVDIVTEKFPPLLKRVVEAVSDLLTALLFGIISLQVWRWGDNLRMNGELSETLQIRFYPFVYCVAAGFALLTIVLALQFFDSLLHRPKREGNTSGPSET
jgi:TRAP-type C4-dicarboxylate transport system permease small subunit